MIIYGEDKGVFYPVNFRFSGKRDAGEDCCSSGSGFANSHQLFPRDEFGFVEFKIEKSVIRYTEERMDKQSIQE